MKFAHYSALNSYAGKYTEEYWNISGKALHSIPIFYQTQYKASATYQFINYSTTSYHPSLEQKLQLPEQ